MKTLELRKEYDHILTCEIKPKKKGMKVLIYIVIKRLIDITLSISGLLISIPILVAAAILIKLGSKGPILFIQERVGLNGEVFRMYKLRTMVEDAEKNGAQWADKNDCRVTRIGVFLRRTRIDEIPQLVNILKGEMSIVGPRPERAIFTEQFNAEIPGFIDRLRVKPGLTGWAQVRGGYDMTPREKLDADIYYINNRTIIMDIGIILRTVRVVFTGAGAR